MTLDLSAFCEQRLTRLREAGVLEWFESAAPTLRESLPAVVAASEAIETRAVFALI